MPNIEHTVRDLSLSEWGRKEIQIAETEMPGLMALRQQYAGTQPLKGLRITGSLHMTIQTAVLIETLIDLGAELRWASCNIFSTQDHAAAAVVAGRKDHPPASVFAWKGLTLTEYWECLWKAFCFPAFTGPQLIVDDGGDAALMLHKGYELEEGSSWVKEDPSSEEERLLKEQLTRIHQESPDFWHRCVKDLRGVSEETTTGVLRLYQREQDGTLLIPAINVNDSVTKSKFDNLYGCRESLVESIKRATDTMISGKLAVVCGYGNVGKGSVQSLVGQNARVVVTEVDPICALQAAMEGYEVRRLEDVVATADIVVTTTGNRDVIRYEHMQKMKNNAIVCNIGHFDNEIEVAKLDRPDIRREQIKPQVDRYVFPDGHGIILLAEGRLVNLGCGTGHPSFVMSISFTNQVLAQLDLWNTGYQPGLYYLSRELDEEVARLHLERLGADLTELRAEQSRYIGVSPQGPYKMEHYRY